MLLHIRADGHACAVGSIRTGKDERTSVMIKNVPNKYTKAALLQLIDTNHAGTYDFFYLPIDCRNKCNLGYAFLNVKEPGTIVSLLEEFSGKRWERFRSDKVCEITYARIQGKEALVEHFRNSKLIHKHQKYRPLVADVDGNLVDYVHCADSAPDDPWAPGYDSSLSAQWQGVCTGAGSLVPGTMLHSLVSVPSSSSGKSSSPSSGTSQASSPSSSPTMTGTLSKTTPCSGGSFHRWVASSPHDSKSTTAQALTSSTAQRRLHSVFAQGWGQQAESDKADAAAAETALRVANVSIQPEDEEGQCDCQQEPARAPCQRGSTQDADTCGQTEIQSLSEAAFHLDSVCGLGSCDRVDSTPDDHYSLTATEARSTYAEAQPSQSMRPSSGNDDWGMGCGLALQLHLRDSQHSGQHIPSSSSSAAACRQLLLPSSATQGHAMPNTLAALHQCYQQARRKPVNNPCSGYFGGYDGSEATFSEANAFRPHPNIVSGGNATTSEGAVRGWGAQEFCIDYGAVMQGLDERTSVMIKNVPNKYTKAALLQLIDTNHAGTYDFFYLPIDCRHKCNLGYAFINFRNPRSIVAFAEEFSGKRWKQFRSDKVCVVTYARLQGKAALLEHFQSTRLVHKHEKFCPLVLL